MPADRFPPHDRRDRPDPAEIALSAARCFAGGDGERLLAYLRAMTLERALGPDAGEAQLRHLEGQRQFVLHLQALVHRGRGETPSFTDTDK